MNLNIKKICSLKNCNKEAEGFCSTCKGVEYCSQEHQEQDWRAGHKRECGRIFEDQQKQKLLLLYKSRVSKRKEYYGMFLAHRTEEMLKTVRELDCIESEIDEISKNQFADEF